MVGDPGCEPGTSKHSFFVVFKENFYFISQIGNIERLIS